MKPTRWYILLPFCCALVILSSCAGPARSFVDADSLPAQWIKEHQTTMHIVWQRDDWRNPLTTRGILLEQTATHLILFEMGSVTNAMLTHSDQYFASPHTFRYLEIPLDAIVSVELVMPSPSRDIPETMLLGANLLPLIIATPGSAPYYHAYWSDSPPPDLALTPLSIGAVLGGVLGIIQTWSVRATDKAALNQIIISTIRTVPPELRNAETVRDPPPAG